MKVRFLVRLASKLYPTVLCLVAGLVATIANDLTSLCALGL